jgi:hypothetical protein
MGFATFEKPSAPNLVARAKLLFYPAALAFRQFVR